MMKIIETDNTNIASGVYIDDITMATITGTDSNDTITGTDGDDVILARGGSDTINAGGGNDVISLRSAPAGSDVINGGTGTDVVIIDGRFADFVVTQSGGSLVFTSSVTGASETLTNVEQFGLDDQTVFIVGAGGYATFQEALAAASDGDTILFAAGSYAGNIDVTKQVTIVGANRGVDGIGTRTAETIFTGGVTISASGVTFDGVTFAGAPTSGSFDVGVSITGNNAKIVNSVFDHDSSANTNDTFGILTGAVTGLDVSHNLFEGYAIGAYISGPGSTGSVHDNLFQGEYDSSAPTTFAGLGNGVNSESSVLTITHNTFDALYAGVVQVLASDPASLDVNTIVFDNTYTDNRAERPIQIYPNGIVTTVIGTDINESFNGDQVAGGRDFSFYGHGGDDRLFGGAGNDLLDGGTGNDGLFGGDGTDTAHFTGTVTIDDISILADANPFDAGSQPGFTVNGHAEGSDTLYGVEIISSSAGRILLVSASGFATIQTAIDAASAGDTIYVPAGTYDETLLINKDVTIVGANNHGIDGSGVRGSETIITGGVTISSNGVTLDGLKFTGAPTSGSFDVGVSITGNNAKIVNSVFDHDSSANTNDTFGILTGAVTGLDVSHNLFEGYAIGAYISGPGSTGSVHDNLFQGEYDSSAPTTFAGLGNGVNSESSVLTITHNTFDALYAGVVQVLASDPASLDVNTIVFDNTYTDNRAERPIQIYPNGIVTTVIGTDINESFNGDQVAGGRDFSFYGHGGDDRLFGGAGNDLLDGGTGNDGLFGGDGTDTAHFTGTVTIDDISILADANPFDAGSQPGFTVNGHAEGSDTLYGVEIISSSAGRILLVSASGFATIQTAIDAASAGDTIYVPAGTYDETLLINKDVTIVGANNHGIDGSGVRGSETIITGGVTISSNGVTLDGLKFTGAPTSGSFDVGVSITGNNAKIVNSVFDHDSSANTNDTFGILTGAVTGLDVSHNLFEGYAIGAYISGPGSTGSVHDNLFQGEYDSSAPTTFAGLGNGVNSESSVLTITHNTFDALYAGVVQVLASDPASLDVNTIVFDNTYTDNRAERPIQIYPNGIVTTVIGTDINESFNGDQVAGGRDFSFYGHGGDDRLFGGAGNDLLDGGTGNDFLDGGAGNDTFVVDSLLDVVVGGSGIDTVRTTTETYTLGADVENLTAADSPNALDGQGNALANDITGSAFDDTLQGLAGDDIIHGGDGSDTILGGNDNDQLFGQTGDDILVGGNGNDILDGGVGADVLRGGVGNDTYYVDDAGDIVQESAGQGDDLVYAVGIDYKLGANVERLTYVGTGNFTGTGNGLDNFITGGIGDDHLIGGAGNDVLDGGAGLDTMEGGTGDDTYYVDRRVDVVVENANEGNDTVIASLSKYRLSANVENLQTTFTGGFVGVGNNTDNRITGNIGDDTLQGKSGADTLIGNDGNDTLVGDDGADILIGGHGADRFVYNFVSDSVAGSMDRITDFSHADGDRIDVSLIDAIDGGGDDDFTFIGSTAFHNIAGELRAGTSGGNTLVQGDTNGDGIADFTLQLDGLVTLTSDDFMGVTAAASQSHVQDKMSPVPTLNVVINIGEEQSGPHQFEALLSNLAGDPTSDFGVTVSAHWMNDNVHITGIDSLSSSHIVELAHYAVLPVYDMI